MDNVLLRASATAIEFIDDKVRLSNTMSLMNKENLQREFVAALGDHQAEIERQLQDLVDWMLSRNSRHWAVTMGIVQQRLETQLRRQQEEKRRDASWPLQASTEEHLEVLQGSASTDRDFVPRRVEIVAAFRKVAQRATAGSDREEAAQKMSASATQGLIQTAALQASAVGVGGAMVLAGSVFDVTALLTTGGLAVLGLAVVPYRRREAKEQIRSSMDTARAELKAAMTADFNAEVANYQMQVEGACRPFTTFVEHEYDEAQVSQQRLKDAREFSSVLKDEIEALH